MRRVRLAAPKHKYHQGTEVSGGFNGAASRTLIKYQREFAVIGVHSQFYNDSFSFKRLLIQDLIA
jgi:hypothetical protein